MAALLLVVGRFLTENTDVGDQVLGFLAVRSRMLVRFLRPPSQASSGSLRAGTVTRWPQSRTPVTM